MNICMITPEYPPDCGGIGSYVYNLSRHLIQRGHKISIFTRGCWSHDCISTSSEGIDIHKVRYAAVHPLSMQFHGRFLNNVLKDICGKYDLIHLHTPIVPTIRASCPVIITQHGTLFKDLQNTDITNINSLFSKVFEKWFVQNEVNALKSSDVITAVSKSCAEEIRDIYKINSPINVMHNGVDTDYFVPDEDSVESGSVLYTGRLHSRKGLLDLVECAKYVIQQNHSAKFVITGKGPLQNLLLDKVKKLNLENKVILAGFVDKARLLRYYQSSSIYVLPSYYEGFPTSLLEAMSCGMPSVVTNVPGSSELIIDGKNGLLVPPKEPQIMAERILHLMDCEKQRRVLGLNARKYIEDNYGWDNITSNIERIYKQMAPADDLMS